MPFIIVVRVDTGVDERFRGVVNELMSVLGCLASKVDITVFIVVLMSGCVLLFSPRVHQYGYL